MSSIKIATFFETNKHNAKLGAYRQDIQRIVNEDKIESKKLMKDCNANTAL